MISRAVLCYGRVRTWVFTWFLAGEFKQFGKGSRVSAPFRFHGLHEMSVGKDVMIHRDAWIHVIGNKGKNAPPRIVFKDNVGVGMGATISAAENVTLEENVLLARNVYISDHAHAFEDITLPIAAQGISGIKPVLIKKSTWLGQNVAVLPGARIGQHCIIGANSVVNSQIPDFSVAVGAPARVVRQYDPISKTWKRVSCAANRSIDSDPGVPDDSSDKHSVCSRT